MQECKQFKSLHLVFLATMFMYVYVFCVFDYQLHGNNVNYDDSMMSIFEIVSSSSVESLFNYTTS